MSDWTYNIPDTTKFMKALMVILKSKEKEIAKLLHGCTLEISHGQQFSRKRWDAFNITVHFYVPLEQFELVTESFDDEMRERLVHICDSIMPKTAGLDIQSVEFSPSLEDIPAVKINDELEKDIAEEQTRARELEARGKFKEFEVKIAEYEKLVKERASEPRFQAFSKKILTS